MSALQYHIALAKSLPPRLIRFFAKYPPLAILPAATNSSSSDREAPTPSTNYNEDTRPSPFQPHKSPITGRWHDPRFSLRRQADLVKLAREHGVEELMPHSIKSAAEKLRRREEGGLRVKGTGVGQKVKGKEWERTLKGRLEKRRQAMLAMPQTIATWKERGHGRGWKKWPK